MSAAGKRGEAWRAAAESSGFAPKRGLVRRRGGAPLPYRHEDKYLVTETDLALLAQRLSGLLALDPHTGARGCYPIRSVYFDDWNDSGMRENEAGTDPREKWRVRLYDAGADVVTLEKKSKKNGMTRKEQASLDREQARLLLRGGFLPVTEQALRDAPALVRQFALRQRLGRMQPKVIVSYERTAYVCRTGNVRITFDRSIAAATAFDRFFEPELAGRPVLPAGRHVLEVKYDTFLPEYLKRQLELGAARRTSFSKYYLCRRAAAPGGRMGGTDDV